MVSVKVNLFYETIPVIRTQLFGLMGLASDAAAEQLRENLAPHETSGRKWKQLPARSSRPGEFPQYQTGQLHDAVVSQPVEPGWSARWHVGFEGIDKKVLKQLEFAPPNRGGRRPLGTTMMATATQAKMNQAVAQGQKI